MSDLVLYRDGQPIDLNEHPSLLASLHASDRAITEIDDEIAEIEARREELTERIELHEAIGLPAKGPKSVRTRLGHRMGGLKRRRQAHQKNYLEIPDMGGDLLKIGENPWGHRRWDPRENLSTSVPLDVLRALKHAKEQDIFDEFRLYAPFDTGGDPVIVGVAGGATFYIASWR